MTAPALKTARCTFISRRGEVERLFIVPPSSLQQSDGARREVRVEFGAECHVSPAPALQFSPLTRVYEQSSNPSRIVEVPVVGKGKARQQDGFLITLPAKDVHKLA